VDGGGQSKTYSFSIPTDHDPGLFWYHNHVKGVRTHYICYCRYFVAYHYSVTDVSVNSHFSVNPSFAQILTYSYLSSLFGFFVVEGTDADITSAPGVKGATEVFLAISEGLVNDTDKSVPPIFPIAFEFDWTSVANGHRSQDTVFQFEQGETVLFRTVSATVEPPIRLTVPGAESFVVVARDGRALPEPEQVDEVYLAGGGRVEFLARFDTPGNYTMSRLPWQVLPNAEACLEAFGVEAYPCVSYDIEKEVANIVVTPVDDTSSLSTEPIIDSVELPPPSQKLQEMLDRVVVGEKLIEMQQALEFPIFQIPYDGPFVPPGVGFGMNGRLANPQYYAGNVTSGTCETWTVTSFPPGFDHPFHAHNSLFLVTHLDGQEVDVPEFRDTYAVKNHNMTIKICFEDGLEEGSPLMVHCHMPSHQDIGMSMKFKVLAGNVDDSGASSGSFSKKLFTTATSLLLVVSSVYLLS